ncbi:MAG: sarcosine oxidase subunit delta, partial [Rhodospirillaceae bacterium]|nr:sarcosine oxidase subunit delta [Rhodospirillaceae bacterium]
MILITCPHCGPRQESEFTYGGDGANARPAAPEDVDDAAWIDYLHLRDNHKGPHDELWQHVQGCRRWLQVRRDVVTQQ